MNRKLIVGALMVAASTLARAGAVVVGRDSPFQPMDAEMARRIFLGRVPAVDGKPVTVIYQLAGPLRSDFEIRVIGRTGADLNAYMARLIFTGEATPPVEAYGDDGVKAKVKSNPGAIGYINGSAVDGSVKVVLTY